MWPWILDVWAAQKWEERKTIGGAGEKAEDGQKGVLPGLTSVPP